MLAIIREGERTSQSPPPGEREKMGEHSGGKKHSARQRLQRKAFVKWSKKKDRPMIIDSKPGQGAGDHASIYIYSLLTAIFHFLPPHPVSTERGGGVRGLDICIAWERSDIWQPFDFKFSFLVWQSFFESFRRREWLTDRRCAPSTYLNSEPLSE